MNINLLPDYILYPSEDREAFLQLAAQLQRDYAPRDEDEKQILNEMLIASWLRIRYEKVRTSLYTTKNTLAQSEPNSPRLPVVVDSIHRFQLEVEQQKRQLSNLRRQFRNLRAGLPFVQNEANFESTFKETRRELAPAA